MAEAAQETNQDRVTASVPRSLCAAVPPFQAHTPFLPQLPKPMLTGLDDDKCAAQLYLAVRR